MSAESNATPSVPAVEGIDRRGFDADIRMAGQPIILKGVAADWPAVRAARNGPQALAAYLLAFESGTPIRVSVCPETLKGQFFYNDDMTGVNYKTFNWPLRTIIDACLSSQGRDAIYVQARPVEEVVPAMAADLVMPLLDRRIPPRLWLGNTLRTQTHFDYTSNIAVHVAGEKTFTLFPPDQTANLYPGPLDRSPAGVPVSMATIEAPDFQRFPALRTAMKHAVVAHLSPGDALFIPPLWWHHVETTGPLNMLVNYWWNDARPDLVDPVAALHIAALAFRTMPDAQRLAWGEMMRYFVFEGAPAAHLPAHVRGAFNPDLSPEEMARIKHFFLGARKQP